mmetsp:Transcript_9698/g.14450  ORF Transcript_9698/g.14450 Transcript_9698/m.14450 type:complete len:206 (+) Transcript_9698:2226-2843(+)
MNPSKLVLKVIILGDTGVGKSSLLDRYVKNEFTKQYKATIGADFLSREVSLEGTPVKLQLWDTAGQERYVCLAHSFYRGADCCVLVYDISSYKSFESVKEWKDRFLEEAEPTDELAFPFLLLGNKADLTTREVNWEEASEWASANGVMPFYEVSAKESTNVEFAFGEAAKNALRRLKATKTISIRESFALKESSSSKKKNCCKGS